MDDINFISIIDYIGEINNGVAILFSMKIQENIYQIGYWFDKDDNYIMSADEKFLLDFNLKDIYDYPKHKELAYYIHTFVLDNKEDILKEFLSE